MQGRLPEAVGGKDLAAMNLHMALGGMTGCAGQGKQAREAQGEAGTNACPVNLVLSPVSFFLTKAFKMETRFNLDFRVVKTHLLLAIFSSGTMYK